MGCTIISRPALFQNTTPQTPTTKQNKLRSPSQEESAWDPLSLSCMCLLLGWLLFYLTQGEIPPSCPLPGSLVGRVPSEESSQAWHMLPLPEDRATGWIGARFNTLELTKEFARTHSNADGKFFMKFCSLGKDQTQNRTCKTQRSAIKRLDFIPLRGGPN